MIQTHPLRFERVESPVGQTWFLHTWHHEGVTFIVGGLGAGGQVLRSEDDGLSWTPTKWKNATAVGPWRGKFGRDNQHGLRQIWGPSARELYVVGEYGTVLYSADGAKSFERIPHPLCDCIFGLIGYRDQVFISSDVGIRRRSGKSWKIIDNSASKLLGRLYVCGGSLWCNGDEAVLLRSRDGKSFSRVAVESRMNLYSFASLDDGRRIICGGKGGFLISEDGETFYEKKTPQKDLCWNGLLVVGDMVLALGQQKKMLASYDGGGSWTEVPNPSDDELWSGTITEQGTLIVVGRSGNILRATR